MNLQKRLRSHKAKIAVWGTGYIGLSTMAYQAKDGIRCVRYDIVPETIRRINAGEISLGGLGQWLGFSAIPLVKNGLMHATSKVKDIIDDSSIKVHFISIPTERKGKPWDGALQDVSKKLAAKKVENGPDLVIVESTLSPGQCDKVLVSTLRRSGRDVPDEFQVAVAPRRDWFDNPGLNVHTIPRVVGGLDDESRGSAMDVLGIICSKLVPVSDHSIAKSLSGSSVGILGLSYKRNLKVHVLSPTIMLAETLKKAGKQVLIQDPFYSSREIEEIAGVGTFNYPEDLRKFDSVVVSVPHLEYTETPVPALLKPIKQVTFVLDAEGAWQSYRDFFHQQGIDYRKICDAACARPR